VYMVSFCRNDVGMVDVELSGGVWAGFQRPRRSAEKRRRIVEETLLAGVIGAAGGAEAWVNANQVFQWRRLYQAWLRHATVFPKHDLQAPDRRDPRYQHEAALET